MRASKRKIKLAQRKKIKKLVKESDLRRIIRENLIMKEGFETLEDLRGAQSQVEGSLENGVREAQKEVKSGAFENMLEQFFNSLGFVDPCDLVRKDPKIIETQADKLEQALEDLRVAKAENINNKLSDFSTALFAGGAGSLSVFAFSNMKNIARAGAGGVWDFVRNKENDEVNKAIMQKAQQGLSKDQQNPDIKTNTGGGEYSRDTAIARIKSIDDAIEAGMMPKEPPPITQMAQSAGLISSPDVAEAATGIVNRWSSTGFDKSNLFPDGKRYIPFQVFLKKKGFFRDKYAFDEKEISAKEKAELRKKGIHHTRIQSYRRDQNISSAFVRTELAENPLLHPDYIDISTLTAAGKVGTDALAMAMLEKSKHFEKLGYKDPRHFWDDMTNKFTEATSVVQDESRGWFEAGTAELRGQRPTEWQIYFEPKGSPGDRAVRNVATAHMDDFLAPNRVPRNANPCKSDEVPGQGGKCVPAINWNNKAWFTAGKYMVIGAAILFVYKTLLSWAPGAICTIKKFVGKVFSGIFGFIKNLVGGIVGAIKDAIGYIVDGVSGLFESKTTINTKEVIKIQESVLLWNSIDSGICNIVKEISKIKRDGYMKNIKKKSGKNIPDINRLKLQVENKIRENKIKDSVRFYVECEKSKTRWLHNHKLNERARKLKLSSYFINENVDPNQVAGQQSIQAAQKQVDPLKDAFAIFRAMKGAGTNEAEVERVIRKRLDSLDKLYAEFSALMDLMREKKATFNQNLQNSNFAAVLGGAAYGIYALTPDETKKKVSDKMKDLAGKAGDKINQALGKSSPDKVVSQLPKEVQQALKDPEKVNQTIDAVMPSIVGDVLKQTAENAPEVGQSFTISLGDGPSMPIDDYKIKAGDEGIITVGSAEVKFQVRDIQGKAFSGTYIQIDAPGGQIMAKSVEEAKRQLAQAQEAGALGKTNESTLRENEVMTATNSLISAYGGKNAAKHIALAGASAIAAKYATAAAKTWWDAVGLDSDLIQWLEDDGMSDEADLVRKAVEGAGMNVSSSSEYDRGY